MRNINRKIVIFTYPGCNVEQLVKEREDCCHLYHNYFSLDGLNMKDVVECTILPNLEKYNYVLVHLNKELAKYLSDNYLELDINHIYMLPHENCLETFVGKLFMDGWKHDSIQEYIKRFDDDVSSTKNNHFSDGIGHAALTGKLDIRDHIWWLETF